MTGRVPEVARLLMPERGIFLVGLPEGFDPAYGMRCLAQLGYGEDVGEVKSFGPYDPAMHGDRLPGFQLLRPLTAKDDERLEANAALAKSMCVTFNKLAQEQADGVRIVYKRLSFGRERLFVRYVSDTPRADLRRPCAELKRLFNVTVNAWQLGPRDEVALTGALGPCGRVCCCADWQTHYPQGLTAERVRAMGAGAGAQNGICGRFKCCLAFQD